MSPAPPYSDIYIEIYLTVTYIHTKTTDRNVWKIRAKNFVFEKIQPKLFE